MVAAGPIPRVTALSRSVISINSALFMTPLSYIIAVSQRVSASIGPNAQLEISNLELAPDGFSRSFVLLLLAICGTDP